jgi:hypothetical protein
MCGNGHRDKCSYVDIINPNLARKSANMGVDIATGEQLVHKFLVSTRQYRSANLIRSGIFVLMMSLSLVAVSPTHAVTFEESQTKADFLYHFFHFIKWPSRGAEETRKPLVFCAFDKGPVENALQQLIMAPQARDPTVFFGLISDPSEASTCNYIFISGAKKHLIADAIESTYGKAILTVSDSEGFAQQGGMIELAHWGTRIHVLINLQNVTASGLKASSKLLQIATIVSSTESGSDP